MSKAVSASTFEDQLNELRARGFQVRALEAGPGPGPLGQSPRAGAGRYRAEKGYCAALLEAGPGGALLLQKPGYLIGDEIGYLLDGGYQKFLSTPSRKLPATAGRLSEIHAFEEELRAVLGLTSLYNESLGTVSERYHYDRVKGRE